MISSLSGKLIYKDTSVAVIECGGIGFKCFITASTSAFLPNVNDNAFLYTYLSVKEDALDLYGFSSNEELEVFKLITSVSGVGPKIGMAVVSVITPEKVLLSIASGDAKSLTAASGVGLKLAQRIILELKDKLGGIDFGGRQESISSATVNMNTSSSTKDAVDALVSLGYSQSDAFVAVGKLNPQLSADELIKGALKSLASGRLK